MACNCKAKKVADAALEMSGENNADDTSENIFTKLASFLMRFVLGILVAAVFLVLAVPVVLYIAICIVLGRQPSINVGKFAKWGSKLNGGD